MSFDSSTTATCGPSLNPLKVNCPRYFLSFNFQMVLDAFIERRLFTIILVNLSLIHNKRTQFCYLAGIGFKHVTPSLATRQHLILAGPSVVIKF